MFLFLFEVNGQWRALFLVELCFFSFLKGICVFVWTANTVFVSTEGREMDCDEVERSAG